MSEKVWYSPKLNRLHIGSGFVFKNKHGKFIKCYTQDPFLLKLHNFYYIGIL